MRRHLVIYNPEAGLGSARGRIEEVKQHLDSATLVYDMRLTEGPGHASQLAEEAVLRNEFDVVVAAGGDGTVNEVINGLMSRKRSAHSTPSLGVLSVGRGNDFAYGAGVPTDPQNGVAVLADAFEQPLDVGLLTGGDYPNGRYFGNGIGVGFDTIVGLEAAKLKRIRGFAGYAVAAFKTLLFYYVTPHLEMRIDDTVLREPAIQVSVMNGRRLGGGFYMAPDADTRDSVFDFCIAGKPRRIQMLGLLLRYMKGTQSQSKHIKTGTARTFTIRALEGTMSIHADGETMGIGTTEVSFKCIPSPLRVVTTDSSLS